MLTKMAVGPDFLEQAGWPPEPDHQSIFFTKRMPRVVKKVNIIGQSEVSELLAPGPCTLP